MNHATAGTSNASEFPVLASVTVGTLGKDTNVTKLLTESGVTIEDRHDALELIPLQSVKTSLELIAMTVEELGLPNSSSLFQICIAAGSRGLSLCPAEVVLQFWRQCPDALSNGKCALVAMDPVVNSHGRRVLFNLCRHHDNRGLITLDTYDDYYSFNRFLFVRSQ